MSIAELGSPGTASDLVGNNMNTWDVARAINSNAADSSTLLSSAAATALLLSYPSSSTPDKDNQQRTASVERSFREPVVNIPTDKVRVVLCASNCGCSGSCGQELEQAGGGSKEETVVMDSTQVDSSDSTGWDSTSQESYDMSGNEADQLLFGYGAMSAFYSAFNGSFNDSLDGNSSLDNETYIEGLYPSGYGLPHIIVASIVVTVLMIVIVIGNMLVIIAIATEKALKNIQNWFIASLAVADFFLGLVIMPFSLANEIMGFWIFGTWWCDIHSAMDVLLCTASIMNLCLISLDRFWSITQAVEYLKKRTPARAALMIAMVWVLSAVICIPPLLGWKRSAPEEEDEFPKCKHWDGTLFCGNLDNSEKKNIIEDVRFKLGFDHVELLDSKVTRRENIQLLTSTGSLETLSMTFTFQSSDTVINGKIRICSVLYEPIVSIYKLHLSRVVIKTIVGLCIVEDSYHITHIKHEFLDAHISLMYKKESKMIPVYHKVQVKCIKHSLAHYILQNSMKNDISVIERKLHSAFNLTSVSISLKGIYAYRNLFRSHAKNMTVTFNKLVDEIIDSTNLILVKKVSKITLPNISVILDFKKNQKKSVQAFNNSLTGLNFLLRVNAVSISIENDIIIIHAPVDFADLNLSEDIGYVIYSALGSFYIPSCIMVFVYIRIYFAAKARARRGIRKVPRPRPAAPPPESPDIRQTSFTHTTSTGTPGTGSGGDPRKSPTSAMENVATIENQPVQIPIVTCDFASDVSTSEADPGGGTIQMEEKDTLKVTLPLSMQKSSLKATLSVNGEGQSGQGHPARCRAPSVGIDVDMVSELDPSSSDSGVVSRCAVVKPLKLRFCKPIFGRKAIEKMKQQHHHHHHQHDDERHHRELVVEAKPQKPRDPEREKRRLARKKEKRATLILGLIMGSFIACWLPFFFLYIVKPLFPNLAIPEQAFAIAFWLGYMNSALNPVIYTVFNKDFRRAFRRILFK